MHASVFIEVDSPPSYEINTNLRLNSTQVLVSMSSDCFGTVSLTTSNIEKTD
jgi:hypothetical protein